MHLWRVSRLVVTSVVCGVCWTGGAFAQEGHPRPTRPGWQPRTDGIAGPMTAAQRAQAIATLDAIEQMLRRVPALDAPDGFVVWPRLVGGTRRLGAQDREDARNVFEYRLMLDLCVPTIEYGCGFIEVTVNQTTPPGDMPIHDAQGRALYIEAARSDAYRDPDTPGTFTRATIPGATETYYKLSPSDRSWVTAIFTAGGELPWPPVSREEYYNARLSDIEGRGGEKLAEFRQAKETSAYRQWLAGGAQRKQEREEMLRGLVGIQPPAEIAALRKTLEDTERDTTEQLRRADATDPDANERELNASYGLQDRLRAELEALSPADRRQPAIIDLARFANAGATGWAFTDRDSPTAVRVLTPNLDFWRARKSPVEIRSITINIVASSGGGPPPPVVHAALWTTYETLDWAAIAKIVANSR